MEGINKIISLFLGLVVVIILFAIITGRFSPFKKDNTKVSNAKITVTQTPTPTPQGQKKFLGIFDIGGKKPTVTPTPTSNKVVIDTTKETNTYIQNPNNPTVKLTSANTYNPKTGNVTTIPATGAPTALLPLLGSSLLAGIYLRRKK